jgi:hypothetical protein
VVGSARGSNGGLSAPTRATPGGGRAAIMAAPTGTQCRQHRRLQRLATGVPSPAGGAAPLPAPSARPAPSAALGRWLARARPGELEGLARLGWCCAGLLADSLAGHGEPVTARRLHAEGLRLRTLGLCKVTTSARHL